MKMRRLVSGILAIVMMFSCMGLTALAAEPGSDQVASQEERVYVNSYGTGERSTDFNDHWRFYLGDAAGAEAELFNDSTWTDVTLPHDYSIDQGFTHASPAEQENGYVLGGTGWYRKSFTLSEDMRGKSISVDFDGVYMNATVYLNGERLGEHHYGYTPFSFVLPSDSLKFGGGENMLAVKVDHQLPSSRYYSGSGIYRNVYLTVTDPVHTAYHGNYVSTPDIANGSGRVQVETTVQNDGTESKQVSLKHTVYRYNADNSALLETPVLVGDATAAQALAAGATVEMTSDVTVAEPALWSPDAPNLYRLRTEVLVDGHTVDSVESDFGFRWFKFTTDGFWLNGIEMRMHGVCLHHDQGSLGSEAWRASMERQIDLMKNMGVNAYRTSHNPVSDEMIDICNKKGMLVVEEAYDGWKAYKDGNNHDAGEWFDEKVGADNPIVHGEPDMTWAQFDLEAMVRRDRNAPSIFAWSIGNELVQLTTGSTSDYPQRAQNLINWGAALDNSRVYAYGCNNTNGGTKGVAEVLYNHKDDSGNRGLAGYNYGNGFTSGHDWGWNVYAAETASATNSRGVYDRKDNNTDGSAGDKRLTSYDKSSVGWGQVASDAMWEMTWAPYLFGEFVWTGIDYLGEPTPWNWTGPGANGQSKNSYFGVMDTAGFPKDTYYLYRSQWNDYQNTLHLLPTWDENDIMKDDQGRVEVVVYSNAPYLELELNGKVVGSATATVRDMEVASDDVYVTYNKGTGTFDSSKASGHTSQYATFWVPYEKGTLEVKGYTAPDKAEPITDFEGRSRVSTTKGATRLSASADRAEIDADGRDLSFITIDVTDLTGNIVNAAEPDITVSVTGDGKLMSLDNGVHDDWTNYSSPTRAAGRGKLLAIVQSTKEAGSFTVTASASGMQADSVTVATREVSSGAPTEKRLVSYELSRNFFVKEGGTPVLPGSAKANYSDGSSERLGIVWDALPSELKGTFAVYGKLGGQDSIVSVNVTMIGEIAALLNYSAAVTLGSEPNLPTTRPAVLPDGTVLNAQFPVTWDTKNTDFAAEGLTQVHGAAAVFGQSFVVTADVRVAKGETILTENMVPVAYKSYINGVQTSGELGALADGETGASGAGWTGKGTLAYEYVTSVNLKQVKLYFKDPAPVSGTMRLYRSGNEGQTWEPIEKGLAVSNTSADGVTVRTFDFDMIPGTAFKLEFDKQVTLLEVELMNSVPSFPVGGEAALSALKVGGYTADTALLSGGSYGILDNALTHEDVTAVGKDNASVTILPKNDDGQIRILLESEDNQKRGVFTVELGRANSGSDYAYQDMTVTAPSYTADSGNEGGPAKANDNNTSTFWHSRWGDGGAGEKDLREHPDQRYVQIELKNAALIDALHYLPRSGKDLNGIVTGYRVETSLTGETYTPAAGGAGTWDTTAQWKTAEFSPVEAKFIRLYGVATATNEGAGNENKYMSAAEVRVRRVPAELHSGNTTVKLAAGAESVDYTGKAITPEPTVVYKASSAAAGVTLEKGADYTLTFRNNTQPGTATVVVTGLSGYIGAVETTFTIRAVSEKIEGYASVAVTTGRGEAPALPGTVAANMSTGLQRILEVAWDTIDAEILSELGTFVVYGTVTETGARVPATVTVGDVIGVRQVRAATTLGTPPLLPEQVVVYYSNGDTARRAVTWDLAGKTFAQEDTVVTVTGQIDKLTVEAQALVRVAALPDSADSATPIHVNLALNEDGVENPREWPRTFAYFSAEYDPAHRATDGVKLFASGTGKRIWSDWENNQYHTNTSAAVNDNDRTPFVATAFGSGGTADANQKTYTVSRASVGFMEEDGSSLHKVRLPADYKIEYYSASGGVIPAARLGNDAASGCSNTKGWAADNPIKAYDGWTEVTYIGGKPAVPALTDFKHMVNVAFEPVKTTALRLTLTPQAENWTGLEEFEVYYAPVSENTSFELQELCIDGVNRLADFKDGTMLEVPEKSGVVTAKASGNASVTVLEAVEGAVRVVLLPENGDERQMREYVVQFAYDADSMHLAAAQDERIQVKPARAFAGETVTVTAREGYQITAQSAGLVKSADGTAQEGLVLTKTNSGYTFTMPDYGVTMLGEVTCVPYAVVYSLGSTDAHNGAGNPASYTIEDTFTLNPPTRTGHTFAGWTGTGLTAPTKLVTVPAGSVGQRSYTAVWNTGETFAVTFHTGGGSAIGKQVVPKGGKVTKPNDPAKVGSQFAGWHSDAGLTQAWDFAQSTVTAELDLYAKWEELAFTPDAGQIPAGRFLGKPFTMPGHIQGTVGEDTVTTDVTWNEEEVAALLAATEIETHTVTGTLDGLGGRAITATVAVIPGGIIYFADVGTNDFTPAGQLIVDNSTDIRNTEPDGAYSAERGWGCTNNPDVFAPYYDEGTAPAEYMTFRGFKEEVNHQTIQYQFALDAGTYRVAVGLFDPWAEWAGNRVATVSMHEGSSQIGASQDFNYRTGWAGSGNSGKPGLLTFDAVALAQDGVLSVNIAPKNTGDKNTDVLVSFIVIMQGDEVQTHSVSFDSDGGSAVTAQTVSDGEKAVRPADPTRAGYRFTGWYGDSSTPWDFTTPVTADVALTARWAVETTYTARYNWGDAHPADVALPTDSGSYHSVAEAMNAMDDSYYAGMTLANAQGMWTFSGWTAAEAGSVVTFSGIWTRQDVETFTVTFTSNGGSAIPSVEVPAIGVTLAKPADPIWDGYDFAGWYTDQGLTSPWNFASVVTGDLVLYAKWTQRAYSVTYQLTGLFGAQNGTVAEGGTVEATLVAMEAYLLPETVTVTMGGVPCTEYRYDSATGKLTIPGVTGNVTIAAQGVSAYTVTFRIGSGQPDVVRKVPQNAALSKPVDPVRTGYDFTGWFLSEALAEKWDFNAPVTADMTLYAGWTAQSSGGGSSSSSSNTTTETVKNEDGSTTTTVTNKTTGAVTETTKHPDGTVEKVETKKDGSMTSTETRKDGTKVESTTTAEGKTTATVTVPKGADKATVTIPTPEKPKGGEVAVIVKADGKREVVKTSVATEDGLRVTLTEGAKLEIIDNSKTFADVEADNWAHDAVQFAASRELFTGTGADRFAPADDMSRAMLVTVLARLDGQDTAKGGTWDAVGVAWAKENGVSDGSGLEQAISREQLAVMLYRYAKAEKLDADLKGFSDGGSVSDWAAKAMSWAVESGIITGKGGTLDPQGSATRAEVATMLQRFVERLAK